MKKWIVTIFGVGVFAFGLAGISQATLVGSTVTIQHLFPTITDLYSTLGSPIVAEGNDDAATFSLFWMDLYTVNIEANQILVDFSADGTWTDGPSFFNGLFVNNLDDSSGNPLTGATATTNVAGWNDSRLLIGSNFIGLNFHGLSITTNSFLNASLYFSSSHVFEEQRVGPFISDPQTPIPEPATLFLFGSGLIGFGLHVRRKTLL